MNNALIGFDYRLPSSFNTLKVSEIKKTFFEYGELKLDENNPYYPERSDVKIMREDIKYAIFSINQMFENYGPIYERNMIPLFVANGAFIDDPDKHLKRVANVYESFEEGMTNTEKIRRIYKATPPLIALETLTNSTMSFISQYTGFNNHNTTFGNTSISGYYALIEGLYSNDSNSNFSVVCGSNCGGMYSYFANAPLLEVSTGYKESSAVGCLLLGTAQEKKEIICEISQTKHSEVLPELGKTGYNSNWKKLFPDFNASCVIFSGAYTQLEYEKDFEELLKYQSNLFSFFPEYGNLGSSNVIIGIAKAAEFIQGGIEKVDIVDRDIYGRESLIRVERCR